MTVDIAICDDDGKDLKSVIDILKDIFAERNDECSLQSFHSATDMLEKVTKMDIAILDISMDEMNGIVVLVYKCGQEKLNNLYYQVKEQRRCSTWRKTKNLTLRNLSSRS